jgi:hypothetical protein
LDIPEPIESIANQIAVQLPGVGTELDNRCPGQINVDKVPVNRLEIFERKFKPKRKQE